MAKKRIEKGQKDETRYPGGGGGSREALLAAALLVVGTLAVFWPVAGFQFVNYDDNGFITDNPEVLAGLTWGGIRWAFTSVCYDFYAPVLAISHMAGVQIFGLWAGGHHLINLALHLANILLLWWFLRRATGAHGFAFFTAALFAIHPLHVESVAWITERKDVLSTLFWFLGLLAYSRYAEKPSLRRYLMVAGAMVMGLLSKPMVVTFPATLLLLDFWPLCRWEKAPGPDGARRIPVFSLGKLVVEKLPLFALSALFSFATVWAQRQVGALVPVASLPLASRLPNALVSYGHYLLAMIVPSDLAVYYPHQLGVFPAWKIALSAATLAAVTAAALLLSRSRPYLPMGWAWFLGTLVPVIGIVQVGSQSWADRYSYIPFIGLFVMLTWGIGGEMVRRFRRKWIPAVAAGAYLVVLATLAHAQVWTWRDDFTLFSRVIAVSPNALLGHYQLGIALQNAGRLEEAAAQYEAAIRIQPMNPDPLNNLGTTLLSMGHPRDASECFKKAVQALPSEAKSWFNLGVASMEIEDYPQAVASFREAVLLKYAEPKVFKKLGFSLGQLERWDEAAQAYQQAIDAGGADADTRVNLGLCLQTLGRMREAEAAFQDAIRLFPGSVRAHRSLMELYDLMKNPEGARAEEEALRGLAPPSSPPRPGESADSPERTN
jgi:Flp pilus assembly protein TadD